MEVRDRPYNMRSRHISVTVDLQQICSNALAIRRRTGVPLIAVVKSDAYGLGAPRVAEALANIADEFAYFSLAEAREVGRRGIVLGPPEGEPAEYRELGLRPSIGTAADAQRFRGEPVAIEVDTGMQRTGCAPDELPALLRICNATEIYTHACGIESIRMLRRATDGLGLRLHGASTSLLDEPEAWLGGVRPGYALYRGALRVTGRLHLVRPTKGAIGYTGFEYPHVGVILAGYSNGVPAGPIVINGRRQRVLEVGMNTSFVSVDPADRAGDEITLLGGDITEQELARHIGCREHAVLCRFGAMGNRTYLPPSVSTAEGSLTREHASAFIQDQTRG